MFKDCNIQLAYIQFASGKISEMIDIVVDHPCQKSREVVETDFRYNND